MSELFLPNTRQKLLDADGNVSHVWMVFFNDLFDRVGRYSANTIDEEEASRLSGTEEIKADLYRTRQDIGSAPSAHVITDQTFAMENAMIAMREELAQVHAELDNLKASTLREELAQLRVELDGIKAGTVI